MAFNPWIFPLILTSICHALDISTSAAAKQTTGFVTAPGASLYYETYGTGPLLVFISGANGDADIWRPIAQNISTYNNYTVAIYDRRGFSRSALATTTTQNYPQRLHTDVNDTRLLIDALSPDKPATVLGTSSGAIVALQMLLTYPDSLSTLIAHEPPALTVLPDVLKLKAAQTSCYATYRAAGIPPAMLQFALLQDPSFTPGSPSSVGFTIDTRTSAYLSGNLQYWFEREFLQYPFQDFNVTDFDKYKEKLVLANGKMTNPVGSQYRANEVIANETGLSVAYLAGSHVGYSGTTMEEFAKDLMELLRGR